MKKRDILPTRPRYISQNINAYHCCIQKSGSQWLRKIFADPLVYRYSGLRGFAPDIDFISHSNRDGLQQPFPESYIISPLYVPYPDFQKMLKPPMYKAMWVMRDPRDFICSQYFSHRYSHVLTTKDITRQREILEKMTMKEGFKYLIEALGYDRYQEERMSALLSWIKAKDDPSVLLIRYEDLISDDQLETFHQIMSHFDIKLDRNQIQRLLNRYRFRKLAGRRKGKEDRMSHYRKGVAGDWKIYFDDNHVEAFKKVAGQSLIELGYEHDMDW